MNIFLDSDGDRACLVIDRPDIDLHIAMEWCEVEELIGALIRGLIDARPDAHTVRLLQQLATREAIDGQS